jgi:hypothetical protein
MECGELGGCLFAPFSEDKEPVLVSSGAFSDLSFGCKILARSNAVGDRLLNLSTRL